MPMLEGQVGGARGTACPWPTMRGEQEHGGGRKARRPGHSCSHRGARTCTLYMLIVQLKN